VKNKLFRILVFFFLIWNQARRPKFVYKLSHIFSFFFHFFHVFFTFFIKIYSARLEPFMKFLIFLIFRIFLQLNCILNWIVLLSETEREKIVDSFRFRFFFFYFNKFVERLHFADLTGYMRLMVWAFLKLICPWFLGLFYHIYPDRIFERISNTAEPQTTKMKSPRR